MRYIYYKKVDEGRDRDRQICYQLSADFVVVVVAGKIDKETTGNAK